MSEPRKTCFVIMPISDPQGYEDGHFNRIYSHLIQPACENMNLEIFRADDVKRTNYIILDIINKIIQSDLVICDLSARNQNVLYELGIRQAFDLPVVLIKDKLTERIFDIQGFRTLDYDESLRVDKVHTDIENLTKAINETINPGPGDINSFTKLLSLKAAKLTDSAPLSQDTSLILNSLQDISTRLLRIESTFNPFKFASIAQPMKIVNLSPKTLPNGELISLGEDVYSNPGGNRLGKWFHNSAEGVILTDQDGKQFIIPKDHEHFNSLSTIPF